MNGGTAFYRPPSSKKDSKRPGLEELGAARRPGKSIDFKQRPETASQSAKYPKLVARPSSGIPPALKELKKTSLNTSKTTIKSRTDIVMMTVTPKQKTQKPPVPPVDKSSLLARTRTESRAKTLLTKMSGEEKVHRKNDSYTLTDITTQPTLNPKDPMNAMELDPGLLDRERTLMALEFEEEHKIMVQTVDNTVDSILSKTNYRPYIERLKSLEFKVSEFKAFYRNPDVYVKHLPMVIVHYEGTVGSNYCNMSGGFELVQNRKFSCHDFMVRRGLYFPATLPEALRSLAQVGNVVIVFNKNHSKTAELAKHLKDFCRDSVVGIFMKKVTNKSSKFISYENILASFESNSKEVFIFAPMHSDMAYWSEPRQKEKERRLATARLVEVHDLQDLDAVLPLCAAKSESHCFHVAFVEDFVSREKDRIRLANSSAEGLAGYFEVGCSLSSLLAKMESFVLSHGAACSFSLVPHDYMGYFKSFESITYRNLLKNLRKWEDEQLGLNCPPAQPGPLMQAAQYYPLANALLSSNAAKLQALPVASILPIYTHQPFLGVLLEYTHSVNKKNQELHSIVQLARYISIL